MDTDAIEIENAQKIKILIIDDHQMIREGLKIMLHSLNRYFNFSIVEAENGERAMFKIGRDNFDIIMLDYQMPGFSGSETVYRILRYKPDSKILALSNYDELVYIQDMMEAGAKGYILKSIEPPEMLKAINCVLSGKPYYSPEVLMKLFETAEENHVRGNAVDLLTPREIEVLQYIASEMTNEEIAEKLYVAKRTIDSHRQNIINKLHVRNTAGLVRAAYRLHLVQ